MHIDTKAFIDYYNKCPINVRESLKDMFKAPITEYLIYSIKTYEDAIPIDDTLDAQISAMLKLGTITKALNDGWKVSGTFYYPTFIITNNTFNFHEIKSEKHIIESQQEFPNSTPIFGLYRDRELAQHSGETFISLWRDFYLGSKI